MSGFLNQVPRLKSVMDTWYREGEKKGYWPSVDTSNVTWDGWSTISSPSGPDETKTYELTLPALVKGNIYQVKGKVDREFLSEFKWEVTPVPLQDTPVDIPVFN